MPAEPSQRARSRPRGNLPTQLRLRLALEQLRSRPRVDITTVAMELGYSSSHSHFTVARRVIAVSETIEVAKRGAGNQVLSFLPMDCVTGQTVSLDPVIYTATVTSQR